MTDTTTEQVRIGELSFDVRVGGPADGPAVLLLHGFPENASMWSGVEPALHAAGLRTIAPDQRGYSPGARPVTATRGRVRRRGSGWSAGCRSTAGW